MDVQDDAYFTLSTGCVGILGILDTVWPRTGSLAAEHTLGDFHSNVAR